MSGGYRVKVSREMEVDVLHGHDLRVTATGGPSFHAETWPKRRFPQADRRIRADSPHGVAQSNRGCGLALARRRWVHSSNQDQLAVRSCGERVNEFSGDFCLLAPERQHMLAGNSKLRRDFVNWPEFCGARYFDVSFEGGHWMQLLRA